MPWASGCVQQAFGLDLPLYAPLLVVASLDLATMISITPGHLGIFEATLFFIYQYLGLGPTEAMILALFDHLVFLAGRGHARLRRVGTLGHCPALAGVPAAAETEQQLPADNRLDEPQPAPAIPTAGKQANMLRR